MDLCIISIDDINLAFVKKKKKAYFDMAES